MIYFDIENLSGQNILMVDDAPENLEILGNIMKGTGLKVSVALDGETALKIIEKRKPDLILLDIMLPGIDGYEVCERLKKDIDTENIPIIFITARMQTDDIVKGFSVGGIDYIIKPFREKEVLVRVNTHLRLNQLMTEKDRLIGELIESRNRFDVMVAAISQVIIRLDSEKRIVSITPKFASSLGYQLSDMLGKPIENFLLAEEKEKILRQLTTRRFNRPTQKLETKFVINNKNTTGDSIQILTVEFDTFGVWNSPNNILSKKEKDGVKKAFTETLCIGDLI